MGGQSFDVNKFDWDEFENKMQSRKQVPIDDEGNFDPKSFDWDSFEKRMAAREATEQRGPLGDILSGVVRGVAVEMPSLFLDTAAATERIARKTFGYDHEQEVGPIGEIAREGKRDLEAFRAEHPILRSKEKPGIIAQGVEAASMSLASGAPGAATGFAIGSMFGPASPVTAPLAALIGFAMSGGITFGLSEYENVIQMADEQGISRDDSEPAAIISGIAEGGFEFASDLITGGILKVAKPLTTPAKEMLKTGIRQLFKTGLKEVLPRAGAVMASETSMEMLTAGVQAEQYKKIGLGDRNFWEGAKDAMGPAFVASVIFAGVGTGATRLHRNSIRRRIENGAIDPKLRMEAAEEVGQILDKIDPDIATTWRSNANEAIKNKENIETDDPDLIRRTAFERANSGKQGLAAWGEATIQDVEAQEFIVKQEVQADKQHDIGQYILAGIATDEISEQDAYAIARNAGIETPAINQAIIHGMDVRRMIEDHDTVELRQFAEENGIPIPQLITSGNQMSVIISESLKDEGSAIYDLAKQVKNLEETATKPGMERAAANLEKKKAALIRMMPSVVGEKGVESDQEERGRLAPVQPEEGLKGKEEALRRSLLKTKPGGKKRVRSSVLEIPGEIAPEAPIVEPKLEPVPEVEKPEKVEGTATGEVPEGEKAGKQVEESINSEIKGLVKYDGAYESFEGYEGPEIHQFTTREDYGELLKGQTFTVTGTPTTESVKTALDRKAKEFGVRPGKFEDKATPIPDAKGKEPWSGAEKLRNKLAQKADELNAKDSAFPSSEHDPKVQDLTNAIESLKLAQRERKAHGDTEVARALEKGANKILAEYPDLKLTSTPKKTDLALEGEGVEKIVSGKKNKAYLPDNTEIKTEYAVVDASNLIASHDDNLVENKAFPKELQPRDRSRKGMRLQVETMAKGLIPERLGESSSVTTGAPIIGEDLIVESGNGRVVAIRKAYEKSSKYKDWLKTNAEKFGLKKEDIESLEKPVLVRIRKSDVNRLEFVKTANQGEVARMSPTEAAKSDAERLNDADISIFEPSDEGNISAASNATFLNRFIKKLGINEATGYLTDDGKYTKQLIDRVQAAIFYKAYGDEHLLTLQAEEADPNIKNILNALTVAAPGFLKARAVDNNLGNTDIVSHIVGAAKIIQSVRSQKIPVVDFLNQQSLFGQIPEYTEKLTRFIDKYKRSGKKMGIVFRNIATNIREGLLDRANKALPGFEKSDINPSETINNAIEKMEAQYEDKQKGLFGRSDEKGRGESERRVSARFADEMAGEQTEEARLENSFQQVKEQLDLFGNKKPGQAKLWDIPKSKPEKKTRAKRKTKPPPREAQLDLFTGKQEHPIQARLFQDFVKSGKKGAEKTSGKVYQPETGAVQGVGRWVKTSPTGRVFEAPSLVAKNAGEIASLLSPIRKQARESLYTVTVDKNNNILEVFEHSRGTKSSSSFHPVEVAGHILNIPNAAKVYFAHNHPSGDPRPSPEDISASKMVEDILGLKDIKSEPFVIGEKTWQPVEYAVTYIGQLKPLEGKEKIKVVESVLSEGKAGRIVQNSNELRKIIKEKYNSKEGILFLDAKLHDLGFLPWPLGKSFKNATSEIFAAAEALNASGYAIVLNKPISHKNRHHFISKLATSLYPHSGLQLFEILEQDKSWADTGIISSIRNAQSDSLKALSTEEILYSTTEPKVKTDTPEFKKWFGKSKIVDENGKPLVVYHGTAGVDFESFDKNATRITQSNEPSGIYFSQSLDTASGYASWAAMYRQAQGEEVVVPAYLKMENPRIVNSLESFYELDSADLRNRGYDGIIRKNTDGLMVEIAVFEPNQIKSIYNQGAFSGSDSRILYKTGEKTRTKTTAEQVLDVVLPYIQNMTQFPTVRVVQSVENLPKRLKSKVSTYSKLSNKQVEGFYDKVDDQVFLIADNLSEGRIKAVLRHEAEGHRGIRLLLGPELDDFLDGIAKAKKHLLVMHDPKLNFKDQEAVRVAADEWIARKIEAGNLSKSVWDDLIRVFRKWLRKIVPNLKLTDSEIQSVLTDTVKNVREGQIDRMREQKGGPVLSTIADKWYSQMTKFVADKLPGKGTPAQFKQMVNSWADKGKFKAEELEWSGLNEWFDSFESSRQTSINEQKGNIERYKRLIEQHKSIGKDYISEDDISIYRNVQEGLKNAEAELKNLKSRKVTKRDILDYLAENNVQIQEVEKGGKRGISDAVKLDALERTVGDIENNLEQFNNLTREAQNALGDWFSTDGADQEAVDTIDKHLKDVGFSVGINETYNNFVDEISEEKTETKFLKYTLPGSKRYRELLLTMPVDLNAEHAARNKRIKELKNRKAGMESEYEQAVNQMTLREDIRRQIGNIDRQIDMVMRESDTGDMRTTYKSSHWKEPNVLAHIRFDERIGPNGEKVLHIAEIQSDWHQEGRKKGYAMSDKAIKRHRELKEKARKGELTGPEDLEIDRFTVEALADSVPQAPFKKTWPLLTIKRMVRFAAENGFNAISWDTGETQFNRWGSEEIAWEKQPNGGWRVYVSEQTGGQAGGIDIENEARIHGLLKENKMRVNTKDQFRRLIKETLSREKTEAEIDKIVDKTWDRMQTENIGTSLPRKEGMEEFYDSKSKKGGLVVEANKFFNKKAWGKAKVGEGELKSDAGYWIGQDKGDWNVLTEHDNKIVRTFSTRQDAKDWIEKEGPPLIKIWRFPITPEMREKALGEGMPLFSTVKNIDLSKELTDDIAFDKKRIDLSKEGISKIASHLYTKFIMQEYPVVALAKKAGKEMAERIENQVRRLRGKGGIVEAILTANPKAFEGLKESGITEYENITKSLKDILSPLTTKDMYQDYERMRVSQRDLAFAKFRPDIVGVDEEKAQKTIDLLQRKYGDDFSKLEDISKEHREFERQAILQPLVKAGWLSEDDYSKIINKPESEYYASFLRQMEDAERQIVGSGKEVVKRIHGSERQKIPSVEGTIANVQRTVKLVESLRLNKQVVELKDLPGFEGVFDEVKPQYRKIAGKYGVYRQSDKKEMAGDVYISRALKTFENKYDAEAFAASKPDTYVVKHPDKSIALPVRPHGAIVVAEDGKKTYYRVPDDVYKALDYYTPEEISSVIKILNIPTRVLRAGATLSTEFIARNPVRDQFTAMVYSKYGYNPFKDFGKGIYHLLKKTDLYNEFKAAGGEQSYFVSLDRQSTNVTARNLTGYKKEGKEKFATLNPVEALRMLSEWMEKGTRLGLYSKAKAKGATAIEAMAESREGTLDFGRIGQEKALNQIIAFWNANLQGTDKMVRSFKSNPGRALMRTALGITLPSIILWGINHDDDRYKSLPEWQKNFFWIILTGKDGPIIRIPKPFELGVIFGSLPERILDHIFENEPGSLKSITEAIGEGASPGLIPTAALPFIEHVANYSFFRGRSLEPMSTQRRSPGMRYTAYTTEIMKSIGETTDISPIKLENWVNVWTGTLGRTTLELMDQLYKPENVPEVGKKWYEITPAIKGFIAREPIGSSSKDVNDFYEYAKKVTEAKADYQILHKKDADESVRFYKKYGQRIRLAKQATLAIRKMAGIRKRIDRMVTAKSIPSDIKRRKIDELNERISKIAKRFNERYVRSV